MTSKGYTWAAVEQFQWCFAEVNLTIVCACARALKPFFARYLPGLLSSHFRSDNRDHESSKDTDPKFPPTIGSHKYGRSGSDKVVSEMQWRDDVSEDTSTNKRGGNDDEARLWKGNTSDKLAHACDASAGRSKTVYGPSMGDYGRSGASSPAPDAASRGDTLRYDTSKRIHVTSETSVTYS
jgi:hypothetical protein